MKALFDTHLLLWVFVDDPRLPQVARAILEDETNLIFYSVASTWEIAIKHALHPDRLSIDASAFIDYCEGSGFDPVPIRDRHVVMLETLNRPKDAAPRNDPFDRIMVAQAKADDLTFITHDSLIPAYAEPCIQAV